MVQGLAGFGQFGPDCKLPDICSVEDRLNMDHSLVLQNMTCQHLSKIMLLKK